MYVTVTVKVIDDPETDAFDVANAMSKAVSGEMTAWDVSYDAQTWHYGGDKFSENER